MTTLRTPSRRPWSLSRKLGLTAWFYILSILVNVGVSSACLLLYFEPAFRASQAAFQQQQQLEQLRSLVRQERIRSIERTDANETLTDTAVAEDPVTSALQGLQYTPLPQALGSAWQELLELARHPLPDPQIGGRTPEVRLAALESRLSSAIHSLGVQRQDSLTRVFQAQRWIIGLLVLTSSLGAAACGAGLWFVRRSVVQPAKLLQEATRQIRGGNFHPQIELPYDDEMGTLGCEISAMARSIARLQAQLVERERRAAAGEMVDQVTHHLRAPLASIRQLAIAASRRNGNHEDVVESQEGISATVAQFEQWLSQLRAGLACTLGQPGPIEVPTLFADVRTAVAPALERHQVRLSVTATPDLPTVWVDRLGLAQALVSLVTNAIQASAAGQTVQVTGRLGAAASPDWEIEIADEGVGIPPEVMDKIFLPFYTTKADGNGLGLGLGQAKAIIEQHGGELQVRSAPDQGTVFTIRLPVHAPSAATGHLEPSVA